MELLYFNKGCLIKTAVKWMKFDDWRWKYCSSDSDSNKFSHYTPLLNELEGGVHWFHLVRPSVHLSVRLSVSGQNRVCSVSSTILTGSISYLDILSTNFRRCVMSYFFFNSKIFIFGNFFETVTFSLSCVHVISMLKLMPDLRFYCSHFDDTSKWFTEHKFLGLAKIANFYFWQFF